MLASVRSPHFDMMNNPGPVIERSYSAFAVPPAWSFAAMCCTLKIKGSRFNIRKENNNQSFPDISFGKICIAEKAQIQKGYIKQGVLNGCGTTFSKRIHKRLHELISRVMFSWRHWISHTLFSFLIHWLLLLNYILVISWNSIAYVISLHLLIYHTVHKFV